jgi:hypothetical protein
MGRTASPLEITWSAVAAIGVLFTAWMIVDAYWDYRAVRAGIRAGYVKPQGDHWWISFGAVVGYSLTLLVWVGFLIVGIIAMEYPPPPPTAQQADVNAVAGWVLIGMEALLAATQIWYRFVRQKIDRPHIPTVPRSSETGGLS